MERTGTPGQPNHFDRGAAFYPLVIQYFVSLHGLIELISRHIARIADNAEPSELQQDGAEALDPGADTFEWYLADPSRRAVTQLFKPLSLRSQVQSDPIEVNPDDLAAELFDEHHYLIPWIARAGGILLILAWETCKASSDQTPLWEFLRHCRNAAAHGSTFNLASGEPRSPAAWGALTITRALHGSPLFHERDDAGLLFMGDPVRLLWDLEQSYPGLSPDLSPYSP